MSGKILLSTAYFPPAEYFSLIKNAREVHIEREENYVKQSYRNRCRILTSGGIMALSVPVMMGETLKTSIKDVRIDYSKRWQQVHFRALKSAYSRSPYYQFYFERFEQAIMKNEKFLLDLNYELLSICLDILGLERIVHYTSQFEPVENREYDYRYRISPKTISYYKGRPYLQVFGDNGFEPGLSIVDLIFNAGPESADHL